jgi:hypothetical protein
VKRKKGTKAYGILSVAGFFMMQVFVYRRRTCFYSATKGKIRCFTLREKRITVCLGEKLFFTVVKPLFSNDAKNLK